MNDKEANDWDARTNYNGCQRKQDISETELIKKGYIMSFACMYNDECIPEEIDCDNGGWKTRRSLKEYAKKNNISDYVIRVVVGHYQRDLHGERVYEFWIKTEAIKETP